MAKQWIAGGLALCLALTLWGCARDGSDALDALFGGVPDASSSSVVSASVSQPTTSGAASSTTSSEASSSVSSSTAASPSVPDVTPPDGVAHFTDRAYDVHHEILGNWGNRDLYPELQQYNVGVIAVYVWDVHQLLARLRLADERGYNRHLEDKEFIRQLVTFVLHIAVTNSQYPQPERESAQSPFFPDTFYSYVSLDLAKQVARDCFAYESAPALIDFFTEYMAVSDNSNITYDPDTTLFRIWSTSSTYSNMYHVRFEETDNGPVKEIRMLGGYGASYSFFYLRGSDGVYRLTHAADNDQPAFDDKTAVTIKQLPDAWYYKDIFGQVGDSVFSYELWCGKLYVSALASDNLERRQTVVIDYLVDDKTAPLTRMPYIRNGKLFFCFESRAVVLDEHLQILYNEPLPRHIIKLAELGMSDRLHNGWMTPYYYFGGYDITDDFSALYYSTEKGLARCDLLSGKDTILDKGLYFYPRLTTSGQSLYMRPYIYEGGSGLIRYDLAGGEMTSYYNWEDLDFIWEDKPVSESEYDLRRLFSNETLDFRSYFSDDLFFGGTFCVHTPWVSLSVGDYEIDNPIMIARPGELDAQHVVLTTDKNPFYFDICAVLDDGRVIFGYDAAYSPGPLYITAQPDFAE